MLPVLGVELIFFSANILKFADGGYIPIAFAIVAIALMLIWTDGMRRLQAKIRAESVETDFLARKLAEKPPTRVEGTAVFLTADISVMPPALIHNLKHNRILHERNFIVRVESANTPRVSEEERIRIEEVAPGFWKAWLRFGYMEQPNVPRALAAAKRLGHRFDIMTTSYFLNRRSLRVGKGSMMPRWQGRVFASLYRSAAEPTNFYRLPSNRVVELGQQMNI